MATCDLMKKIIYIRRLPATRSICVFVLTAIPIFRTEQRLFWGRGKTLARK